MKTFGEDACAPKKENSKVKKKKKAPKEKKAREWPGKLIDT